MAHSDIERSTHPFSSARLTSAPAAMRSGTRLSLSPSVVVSAAVTAGRAPTAMCSALRPNLSRSSTSPRGLLRVVVSQDSVSWGMPDLRKAHGSDLTHPQHQPLALVLARLRHHPNPGGCWAQVDSRYVRLGDETKSITNKSVGTMKPKKEGRKETQRSSKLSYIFYTDTPSTNMGHHFP